jgi:hypothetical protein
VVDDDDVVDGLRDLREHVARGQDRPLLRGEVAQEVTQPADARGVEAVRRLVEDQQLGIAEQRRRRPQALPHAERVGRDAPRGRALELDQPKHLLDARAWQVDRVDQHAEMVAAGSARMEVGSFERRSHPAARLRQLRIGPPEDERPTGRRRREPHDHAKRRRLAGAVGAEEP